MDTVDGYDGSKPAHVEASAAANRSGLSRCDGITSRAQSGLAYEVPSSSSWRVLQEGRLELRRFHGLVVPCEPSCKLFIVRSWSRHMLHDICIGNLGYR